MRWLSKIALKLKFQFLFYILCTMKRQLAPIGGGVWMVNVFFFNMSIPLFLSKKKKKFGILKIFCLKAVRNTTSPPLSQNQTKPNQTNQDWKSFSAERQKKKKPTPPFPLTLTQNQSCPANIIHIDIKDAVKETCIQYGPPILLLLLLPLLFQIRLIHTYIYI